MNRTELGLATMRRLAPGWKQQAARADIAPAARAEMRRNAVRCLRLARAYARILAV